MAVVRPTRRSTGGGRRTAAGWPVRWRVLGGALPALPGSSAQLVRATEDGTRGVCGGAGLRIGARPSRFAAAEARAVQEKFSLLALNLPVGDADRQKVDVAVGTSERWGRYQPDAPIHVVVDVANRFVLACTGGQAANRRLVPFDAVYEELGCQPCRKFWSRLMKAPNA